MATLKAYFNSGSEVSHTL